MSELNYEHVFNVLVDKTAEYVTSNNLKAMVSVEELTPLLSLLSAMRSVRRLVFLL